MPNDATGKPTATAPKGTIVLDEDTRAKLGKLASELGVNGAAKKLDASREMLLAAIGGVGIRRGSAALLKTNLAAREAVAEPHRAA